MHFVGHYRGYKGSQNFKFDDGGQQYLVASSADGRTITIMSHFFRITRNVFGNGSSNVEQSGWRRLRASGATYRRVLEAFLDFKRAAGAAQAVQCKLP